MLVDVIISRKLGIGHGVIMGQDFVRDFSIVGEASIGAGGSVGGLGCRISGLHSL